MNTIKSIPLLFLTLCLLAASSWYFLVYSPSLHLKKLHELSSGQIHLLHVQQFSQTGTLEYALNTPHAFHMPHEKQYLLETPLVTIQKKEQPDITIDAKRALVTESGDTIQLQEDVRMQHSAYKTHAPGIIKTQAITYYPKKKLARTNERISWIQDKNFIESKGATLNLITEKLELLSHINGIYHMDKKTQFKSDKAIASTNKMHQPSEVELIGHAEIVQGKNRISAPRMRYDIQKETFYTDDDIPIYPKNTQKHHSKRTRILINPNAIQAKNHHG